MADKEILDNMDYMAEEIAKLESNLASSKKELDEVNIKVERYQKSLKDVKSNNLAQQARDKAAIGKLLNTKKKLEGSITDLQKEIETLSSKNKHMAENFAANSNIDHKTIKAHQKAAAAWGKRATKTEKDLEKAEKENERIVAENREAIKEKDAEIESEKEKAKEAIESIDLDERIYRRVIFPVFKGHFPNIIKEEDKAVDESSINKFLKAYNASLTADRKFRSAKKNGKAEDVAKLENQAFSNIVSELETKYTKHREDFENVYGQKGTDKYKDLEKELEIKSAKDAVNKIISNKTHALVKKNKMIKIVAYTTVAVLAVGLVFVGLFGGAKVQNAEMGTQLEQTQGDVTAMASNIINNHGIENSKQIVDMNAETGDMLNSLLSDGQVRKTIALKAGKDVDMRAQNDGYNDIVNAQNKATELDAKKDNVINEFKDAIKTGTNIKDKANDVVALSNDMQAQAKMAVNGVQKMVGATSLKMAELQEIVSMVNEPTIDIEMGEQFAQNKTLFSNPAKGGTTLSIGHCQYEKQTGIATVIAGCVDKKGGKYTNLIKIQMDKNLINVDANDILGALRIANNENVTMQVFDKEIAVEVGGGSSEMDSSTSIDVDSLRYSTTETYSAKSGITKITASVIVYENGKYSTVTVEKKYQGKVTASEKEDQLKQALAEKLGFKLAENDMEMGE